MLYRIHCGRRFQQSGGGKRRRSRFQQRDRGRDRGRRASHDRHPPVSADNRLCQRALSVRIRLRISDVSRHFEVLHIASYRICIMLVSCFHISLRIRGRWGVVHQCVSCYAYQLAYQWRIVVVLGGAYQWRITGHFWKGCRFRAYHERIVAYQWRIRSAVCITAYQYCITAYQ